MFNIAHDEDQRVVYTIFDSLLFIHRMKWAVKIVMCKHQLIIFMLIWEVNLIINN